MDEHFFLNEANIMKIFIYHCQHSIYIDDAITQTICMFMDKRITLTMGISGVSFFTNNVIFPYYYLTESQRNLLYEFVASASCETISRGFYRLSNGCITMTAMNDKKLDLRLVWRVVLRCIQRDEQHKKLHRMLASVILQRVLCKIAIGKEDRKYMQDSIESTFSPNEIIECKSSSGFLEHLSCDKRDKDTATVCD